MPSPQRARILLLVVFTLLGFLLSGWLARVPSVRDALGLTPSALGTVLLAASLGTLGATLTAGYVNARFGGTAVMRVSAVVQGLGYLAIGLSTVAGSVGLLVLGVMLQGVAFAPVNVTINVEAASVERRIGRSIMPQFHALFSVGAVVGAGFGAGASYLGVSVLAQFVFAAVLGATVQLACVRGIVHDTRLERVPLEMVAADVPTGAADGAPAGRSARLARPARSPRASAAARSSLSVWSERRTILLGLVVLAAALSEGSANQWIPLAVVDGFGTLEAVGATVLTVFTASMTVVRLLGTRLLDRFGRVTVLRGSGVAALTGLVLFAFAPSFPLAVVGVSLWGVGAALAYPITLAAASDDPLRAAARVSVVTAFASVARLCAPPAIGALGEVIGIRHALGIIAAGLLLSILLAHQARREDVPTEPGTPSSDTASPRPAAPDAQDAPDAPSATDPEPVILEATSSRPAPTR